MGELLGHLSVDGNVIKMDSRKVYLDPVYITKAQGGIQAYPNTFLISAQDEMVRLTASLLCSQQEGFWLLFIKRRGGSESRS